MELGGNDTWKEFFDSHPITQSEGRTFEDSTIKERYEGEVGEEYKERLSAKAEGREYVPGQRPAQPTKKSPDAVSSRSNTPLSNSGRGGRGSSSSPALQEGPGGVEGAQTTRKARNEAYFAKMGSENATRSESLRPSEGGKFTGFGGGMPASSSPKPQGGNGAIPGFDDFQKDPVAALTKGFGWFTTTVGKTAKTVNDSYIQPTAKTVCFLFPFPIPRSHIQPYAHRTNQGNHSSGNPTSPRKPANTPRTSGKTSKWAPAAPQTPSRASSRAPTATPRDVADQVQDPALMDKPNQSARTSGMTFPP
jgi:hypothetical protein